MSAAALDRDQEAIYTAVRAFVLAVLGNIEVVQGLGNRVPSPTGGFCAITAVGAGRLATNTHIYDDNTGTASAAQHQTYNVQIDCYGEASSNWAAVLSTLLRDEYATAQFPAWLQPLYSVDPRQAPLITAEAQYEQRWIVEAVLQYNATVTTGQDFFDTIEVGIIEVDEAYPPT